jgi:hypothetical protein
MGDYDRDGHRGRGTANRPKRARTPPPVVDLTELRAAAERYWLRKEAKEERDFLIRKALEEGASYKALEEATHLKRAVLDVIRRGGPVRP